MSLNTTIASAPGKILLLGGYSVLERPNVSLSVAVNAFVHTTLKPSEDDKIHISSFQISYSSVFSVNELTIQDHTDAGKFVCNALKYSLSYLKAKRIVIKPFSLSTQSDDAFNVGNGKSGLGSSAAVTVATVAAVLKLHGVTSKEIIHNLSQIAHSVSQGKIGSGFDVATSTFGSIVYTRYSLGAFDISRLNDPIYLISCAEKQWDYVIEPFDASKLSLLVGNIVGASASTTEMVKKVMEYKRINPQEYSQLIRELNITNSLGIAALSSNDFEEAAYQISQSLSKLKLLGTHSGCEIIPKTFEDLIAESNKLGAVATLLPGAGGADSIVSLFTSEDAKEKVRELWEKNQIEPLDVSLEKNGVHAHSL